MNKKILLLIAAIIIAGGIIVWKITFQNTDLSVQNEKAAYKVESTALQQEFETDENTANTKYLNKVISVTGIISKIEKNENGLNVTLKDEGAFSGVICGFQDPKELQMDFTEGDMITIKGLCTGYLFDVIMVKCAIERD